MTSQPFVQALLWVEQSLQNHASAHVDTLSQKPLMLPLRTTENYTINPSSLIVYNHILPPRVQVWLEQPLLAESVPTAIRTLLVDLFNTLGWIISLDISTLEIVPLPQTPTPFALDVLLPSNSGISSMLESLWDHVTQQPLFSIPLPQLTLSEWISWLLTMPIPPTHANYLPALSTLIVSKSPQAAMLWTLTCLQLHTHPSLAPIQEYYTDVTVAHLNALGRHYTTATLQAFKTAVQSIPTWIHRVAFAHGAGRHEWSDIHWTASVTSLQLKRAADTPSLTFPVWTTKLLKIKHLKYWILLYVPSRCVEQNQHGVHFYDGVVRLLQSLVNVFQQSDLQWFDTPFIPRIEQLEYTMTFTVCKLFQETVQQTNSIRWEDECVDMITHEPLFLPYRNPNRLQTVLNLTTWFHMWETDHTVLDPFTREPIQYLLSDHNTFHQTQLATLPPPPPHPSPQPPSPTVAPLSLPTTSAPPPSQPPSPLFIPTPRTMPPHLERFARFLHQFTAISLETDSVDDDDDQDENNVEIRPLGHQAFAEILVAAARNNDHQNRTRNQR